MGRRICLADESGKEVCRSGVLDSDTTNLMTGTLTVTG
jgi:hypothetical protein